MSKTKYQNEAVSVPHLLDKHLANTEYDKKLRKVLLAQRKKNQQIASILKDRKGLLTLLTKFQVTKIINTTLKSTIDKDLQKLDDINQLIDSKERYLQKLSLAIKQQGEKISRDRDAYKQETELFKKRTTEVMSNLETFESSVQSKYVNQKALSGMNIVLIIIGTVLSLGAFAGVGYGLYGLIKQQDYLGLVVGGFSIIIISMFFALRLKSYKHKKGD